MSASRLGIVAALVVLLAGAAAQAGSTEPDLAIADASASLHAGVVTLEVVANYDHSNALRLGYPVALVVLQGARRAELFLDGRTTLSLNAGPPLPVSGARGVISIAPTRIAAVLPAGFDIPGTATVSLEATFDGDTLHSNAVQVAW